MWCCPIKVAEFMGQFSTEATKCLCLPYYASVHQIRKRINRNNGTSTIYKISTVTALQLFDYTVFHRTGGGACWMLEDLCSGTQSVPSGLPAGLSSDKRHFPLSTFIGPPLPWPWIVSQSSWTDFLISSCTVCREFALFAVRHLLLNLQMHVRSREICFGFGRRQA